MYVTPRTMNSSTAYFAFASSLIGLLLSLAFASPALAQGSSSSTNGFSPHAPPATSSSPTSSASSARSEKSESPNWRNLAGWEYFKAPTSTQFSLRTSFFGSRTELTGEPLQSWQGFVILTGEVEIVTNRASIWAEIGYRGLDSASDPDTTGWTDLVAGLKIGLIDQGPFLLSIYGGPRLPIGSDSVSGGFNSAQVGLAASLLFGDVIGINSGLEGALRWNLPGESNMAFRGRLYAELAFVPVRTLQARLGLSGMLNHQDVTIESFIAYAEARVSFIFARVGVPFDFSDGANTEADLHLQAGVTFGF